MSKFGNSEYDGPYESQITYDKTVRDNCHAQLNTNAAYRDYEEGEEVLVKAAHNGNAIEFTDTIKTKHENVKYTSIPVAEREKLGLDPHDTVTFWVKSRASERGEQVAIKAGSKVYHKMQDGNILCNHHQATKPGTTANGVLTASVENIGGDWRLCDACSRMEVATNVTRAELVGAVKYLIGGEHESSSFTSAELVGIIEGIDSSVDVTELVAEVNDE